MEMELRKITQEELNEILNKHKLWLESNHTEGEKAYLSGMDLSYMNLIRVNMRFAELEGANLCGTNLKSAYLLRANLCGAKLIQANLCGAKLIQANLYGANLTNANLEGANLVQANLYNANLTGVKNLPDISMACPETGSFIGWKRADNNFIVKLEIPADAKRSSAIGSRKCRCNKARVLSIENIDGTPVDVTEAYSVYDPDFIYKVGETVEVEYFDENRFHECSSGIHFFMTREEAVAY